MLLIYLPLGLRRFPFGGNAQMWRDEHVALHALTEQPVNQRVEVVSP